MFSFADKLARKSKLPDAAQQLPGRNEPLKVNPRHHVLGVDFTGNYPASTEKVVFAMGCFWGAERLFWKLKGVYATAVGYTGGGTPNPTYEEVCSGMTGHTEGVLVVFNPQITSFNQLLKCFWEEHNPTQGMRQGNDVGTQYRSGIYCFSDEQRELAELSKQNYQKQLDAKGLGIITTEIDAAEEFYFAETYHQQYLAKNPNGYCGLNGVGACLEI